LSHLWPDAGALVIAETHKRTGAVECHRDLG
jgi:hypothetical protein